ncbi:MATE family efflux transporter [Roseovarius nanhaiticus]|uniref:MATE family efflux transporter n=1 Tax=Roseovarius nanhaiticus TaxID=573024 RepID=UPI0024916F25|nr:MATE family efflux transporter [Roseovarius nanhaiticus]
MSAEKTLNDGPVGRALWSVSAPMTIGILGVVSVGLADAFFLARDGETSLAAIGYVFPVITALTSLSIGLSAGTNTVISQAIGRGEDAEDRRRMTLHAMTLALGLSCAVSLLVYLLAPYLFGAMGAEGEVLSAILGYMRFWCLSFPFLVTSMALNAVFRAAGRSGVAATTMLMQALLNIALDPVLIFGLGPIPALSMDGAGLASLIARMASFTGLLIFATSIGTVQFSAAPWRGLMASMRRIVRVGAPAAMSNAINPLGMAIVTGFVATIGDTAVAGFGAATRVQGVVVVPLLALSSGIGPVVGQAWGAGNEERARKGLRICHAACVIFGLSVAALLLIFAGPLAAIMTSGSEAQAYTATYLRIASWGFLGYGILITANAAMNARDRALWSMSLSGTRIFALYVPMTWAGVQLGGYGGMIVGALIANLISGWVSLVMVRSVGLGVIDWAPVRVPSRWLSALLGAQGLPAPD